MGYNATSYAVFGIKTARKNMKQLVNVRTCSHNVSEGMKFCPECGEPVYTQEKHDILDSMEEKGLSYFYSNYEGNGDIVLGFCVGKTSYSDNTKPIACKPPSPDMAVEILDFCKAHNLPYTEQNLKMYVMTHHSY